MTSQNDKPSFQHPQDQTVAPNSLPQSPSDVGQVADTAALESRIAALENKLSGRINFNTDLIGLFETVSAAPTAVPRAPYDQIKIYVNGGTLRLYWYDGTGQAWHYVTATA